MKYFIPTIRWQVFLPFLEYCFIHPTSHDKYELQPTNSCNNNIRMCVEVVHSKQLSFLIEAPKSWLILPPSTEAHKSAVPRVASLPLQMTSTPSHCNGPEKPSVGRSDASQLHTPRGDQGFVWHTSGGHLARWTAGGDLGYNTTSL